MGREEIKLENIIKQIELFRESATEQARFAKRDSAEASQMCSEAMAHAYKVCIDLITKINDCKCNKCYPSTINNKTVKICFDCGSIHEYTNKQHYKECMCIDTTTFTEHGKIVSKCIDCGKLIDN